MERATFWRLPDPGAPELLSAKFRTRTFARHAHERFAIGVIEAGGLAFRYRGEDVLAPAGWVNLAFPGEAHSGHAAGPEGWTYRMSYLEPESLVEMVRGLNPGVRELPFIPAGAVWDPDLACRVASLHRRCAAPGAEPLARQTLLGVIIQDVMLRYSTTRPEGDRLRGRAEVQQAKRLLDETFDGTLCLERLAALTGMNPYRLVRCFTKELGLPPHAYLVQVRVQRAAALLRRGVSLPDAAQDVGFADQSHLNRHFLRHYGVTPGTYRRAFQHKT
jgi:AraC-like DNA-binding protein